MSVATIDRMIDEAVLEGPDGDVLDVTALVDRMASLRRAFTGQYQPRHRADGPTVL